jgi:RNA polymerase sporulation-specific sigma factor
MVLRCARQFFLSGGGGDDLVQEGMIGLYRAVLRYDGEKNATFKSFAALCVKRQIIDAVRKNNNVRNQALNNYVSLDDETDFFSPSFENPEDFLISRESFEEFKEKTKNLSKLESVIFKKYLEGKTYSEISAEIKSGEKTVDNALQRIRKKISG